jgi:hypothetical protein
MSICCHCKKLSYDYYSHRCQICTGFFCGTCKPSRIYKSTDKCCNRITVCVACHGPELLCSCCGSKTCRLQIYNCTYCNTKSHIVDHKKMYCQGCKATTNRHVCCECKKNVSKIKTDVVDIKNTINKILCDPSKIVLEYWNDRYMNDCLVDVNKFEIHDTVQCVKCSCTLCEFHGIWECRAERVYCGVCVMGKLGEIN